MGDLDGGFLPTLTAVLLRPGRTLRRYLEGDRRSYMRPARYLLAAIVVAAVLAQLGGRGALGAPARLVLQRRRAHGTVPRRPLTLRGRTHRGLGLDWATPLCEQRGSG